MLPAILSTSLEKSYSPTILSPLSQSQSLSALLSLPPSSSIHPFLSLPLFGRVACHWDLEEIELNYEGISLQYDWHNFPPHNKTSFSYLWVWKNENRPCTILSLILLNWIFHITRPRRHLPFPLRWAANPFHNIRKAQTVIQWGKVLHPTAVYVFLNTEW